jgi:hypothetical protein
MELDVDAILEHIKVKLSISDAEQDELIEIMCGDAYNYMALYLNREKYDELGNEVPPVPNELAFILEAVVIKRYRRIGAEGIITEKIDVLSTTYEVGDDFAEYFDMMNKFMAMDPYKNKAMDLYGKGFRFF